MSEQPVSIIGSPIGPGFVGFTSTPLRNIQRRQEYVQKMHELRDKIGKVDKLLNEQASSGRVMFAKSAVFIHRNSDWGPTPL